MIHMMNCAPHPKKLYPQWRRHGLSWPALLATFVAIIVLALLWVQPVAAQAQAIGPVYALPGTLSHAINKSYDSILTIASGTQYGLVGQTPDIEAQIVEYRTLGETFQVKVWGDRFPAATENDLEVIVVANIQPATPPTATPLPTATAAPTNVPVPTATPVPTTPPTPAVPFAVVSAATINVRSGPSTDYPVVGSLVAGQSCAITGRNQAATWWQLSCTGGVSGWAFGDLLALAGPINTVQVVKTAPPPTPVPPTTFSGWKTTYYNNKFISGNPVLTVDSPDINFNWGTGSPGPGVNSDNFSARFERTMDFAFGTYELAATFDDGINLFVDDQQIIGAWNISPARTRTAQVVLTGSKRIRLDYFEATGNAQVQLTIRLISSTEAWQATYYRGTNFDTPILSRGEPRSGSYQLNYNWGTGSPAPQVPVDQFSARWVGTFSFEGGDYTFHATSDDGVRVYIDGIQVINNWRNGLYTDIQNTFRNLGAGNHQIVVEYYESYGNAQISVWWNRISGGGGNSGRPRDQ